MNLQAWLWNTGGNVGETACCNHSVLSQTRVLMVHRMPASSASIFCVWNAGPRSWGVEQIGSPSMRRGFKKWSHLELGVHDGSINGWVNYWFPSSTGAGWSQLIEALFLYLLPYCQIPISVEKRWRSYRIARVICLFHFIHPHICPLPIRFSLWSHVGVCCVINCHCS